MARSYELQTPVRESTSLSAVDLTENGNKAVVEFTSASCAVMENEGKVRLGIRRYGRLDLPVSVRCVLDFRA